MKQVITLIAAAGLSLSLALTASAESGQSINQVKNTALVEHTDISSRRYYRQYWYDGYGRGYGHGFYVPNYGYFYQPGYGSYYNPHLFGGRFGWW